MQLMKLPMRQWWTRSGKWGILIVLILFVLSSMKFLLIYGMPLEMLLRHAYHVKPTLIQTFVSMMDLPFNLLFYACILLWMAAANHCMLTMRNLLHQTAVPIFDTNPVQRFMVSFGQGLFLLPCFLLMYAFLGYLSALASAYRLNILPATAINGSPQLPLPFITEPITEYSMLAFSIAAIVIWALAFNIASSASVGTWLIGCRGLATLLYSVQQLSASTPISELRPFIRFRMNLANSTFAFPYFFCSFIRCPRQAGQ